MALAVLPDLWRYVSESFGGESWIIKSVSGISIPLAATLVAIRHKNCPFLNPSKVISLYFYGMSPCNTYIGTFIYPSSNKSLASLLVSVKIIVGEFKPP